MVTLTRPVFFFFLLFYGMQQVK